MGGWVGGWEERGGKRDQVVWVRGGGTGKKEGAGGRWERLKTRNMCPFVSGYSRTLSRIGLYTHTHT